jgi:cytoskeletal protein RodZ
MKKLHMRRCLIIAGLLAMAFSLLLGADDWQVGSQTTDSQDSNKNEKWNDDTSQTSNRGQTIEDHQSSERHPDGSGHDHETVSGNGDFDPNGNWEKEGGGWSTTTDTDVSSDGSRSEQHTETITDKDGNTEIWTTSTTHDSRGRKTSETNNHIKKPKGSRVLRPVKA